MHHHDHDHPHDHHHDHHDIRPLRIAMAITTSILVLQIVGGVVSGSLALLSDAGHVFVDLGSLLIAYTGLHLAARASGTMRGTRLACAASRFWPPLPTASCWWGCVSSSPSRLSSGSSIPMTCMPKPCST
ncbi:MAG: cation transporter [Candidatus Kapaibacteriota bacterium]